MTEQKENPYPLGRRVNHDPRSRSFVVATAPTLSTVRHTRIVPIWHQGDVGACVGHSLAGALGTNPHTVGRTFPQEVAFKIYRRSTEIDPFEGSYPPTDTGTDGLSACKAAQEMGYVNSYNWAFGLDQALGALQLGPIITGFNWYSGMNRPNSNGLVTISGNIVGGHEVCAVGHDVENKLVWFANSWGTDWGKNGYFALTWSDWERLLNEQGDVTQFTSILATTTPIFRYRQVEIEKMIKKEGIVEYKIGAAICEAESLAQPDIEVMDTNGRYSVGLFQINLTDGDKPGYSRFGYTREQLKDGPTNIRAASILYTSRGFRPWGAFTNGSYKKYMYPGELRQGMRDVPDAFLRPVRTLQARLNRRGETDLLTVDGDFGPRTKSAVSKFQKYHGMLGSGIVGPLTWGLL